MTDLTAARAYFAAKISTAKPGRIAEQIVSCIDIVLSDDTTTVESQRNAALLQLQINLPRYEQAKAEAASLSTTE